MTESSPSIAQLFKIKRKTNESVIWVMSKKLTPVYRLNESEAVVMFLGTIKTNFIIVGTFGDRFYHKALYKNKIIYLYDELIWTPL